jgi:hypothetical protein
MDLSHYTPDTLQQDGELVLYRGRALTSTNPEPHSVLVSMLTSEQPAPDRVRMLEHEFVLRSELDPTWAVRPQPPSHEPSIDYRTHNLGAEQSIAEAVKTLNQARRRYDWQ